MNVRTALSVVLGLLVLGVGLWTSWVAAENHARGRALDRGQRECEALEVAIDRLSWSIAEEEERLLRGETIDSPAEPPADTEAEE